jgi:signal transduction histidine kinase
VHTILEAHGGSVNVESSENKGSTFRVSLPLLKLRLAAKAESASEVPT